MTLLSQISGPHTVNWYVPAATIAATPTWSMYIVPFDCTVTAVTYVPNANITANGTSYFTLALKKGSTSVASRAWSATDSVANTSEAFTLTATVADRNLTAGDQLDLVRTKASSGLANPDGFMVLTVKRR